MQEIEDRYVKQMKICEANNRIHVMYLLRLLFCMTFTPKLFKLKLPSLDINCLPALYTDTIKYLEYICIYTTTTIMQRCYDKWDCYIVDLIV